MGDDLAVAGVEVERGVELQLDDRGVGAHGGVGHGETEHARDIRPARAAALAVDELHAVAAKDGGGAHGVADAFHGDLSLRAVELEKIERAPVGGERAGSVEMSVGQAGDGVVDRLAVRAQPGADFAQDAGLFVENGAVAERGDVEEEVAPHAGALDEHAEELGGGFVGRVGGHGPTAVHGEAEFPGAGGGVGGDALLGGGVVAVFAHAAVEDDAGTPGAELVAKFAEAPLPGGAFPVAVEPEQVGRVAFAEFAELQAVEAEEVFPAGGVFGLVDRVAVFGPGVGEVGAGAVGIEDGRVVGVGPVEVRVVEAGVEAAGAHGCAERTDEVAGGGGVAHHGVVFGGVPEGHAVVVFGGEHGVARAGLDEEFGPLGGIVAAGEEGVALRHVEIEREGVGGVLAAGAVVDEGPGLGVLADGVDAPVDENAEFGVAEPGHVGSGVGHGKGGRVGRVVERK